MSEGGKEKTPDPQKPALGNGVFKGLQVRAVSPIWLHLSKKEPLFGSKKPTCLGGEKIKKSFQQRGKGNPSSIKWSPWDRQKRCGHYRMLMKEGVRKNNVKHQGGGGK